MVDACVGILGTPRPYMRLQFYEEQQYFHFVFHGCNCGKAAKTMLFSTRKKSAPSSDIPTTVTVRGDETGKTIVQCATILGSILDPGCDVVEYRRRLLRGLQPTWRISDPNARPADWIDRCASGTAWANPDPNYTRVHNMSYDFLMRDIIGCNSVHHNERTAQLSCQVSLVCGCTITAPAVLILEALSAFEGSSLGKYSASLDEYGRIRLHDGRGLMEFAEEGTAWQMIAFRGDIDAHSSHAARCRSKRQGEAVGLSIVKEWPAARALVRDTFRHSTGITARLAKGFGYIDSGGCGNLLISRDSVITNAYRVVGVCVDDYIPSNGVTAVRLH